MNKEIYVIKLPHGWFKGKIKMTDIIDTIDAGINNWHTLIGETNETPQRERESSYQECDQEGLSGS